jgi:hypothetical protein
MATKIKEFVNKRIKLPYKTYIEITDMKARENEYRKINADELIVELVERQLTQIKKEMIIRGEK